MKKLPRLSGRECLFLSEILEASMALRDASDMLRDAQYIAAAESYGILSNDLHRVVISALFEQSEGQ